MTPPNRHTYLSLGTNLGDRLANLLNAVAALPPLVEPLAASPIYETKPWGYSDQPAYLNQVLHAVTTLEPLALLAHLKILETRLGRLPSFRYGPRKIDMDILFYDEIILETPALAIPHPRLAERAFVLVPLADLAPDLRHPVLGKTIQQLLSAIDRQGVNLYPATG